MSLSVSPLPEALVCAIESGVWQTPKGLHAWHPLFSDDEIVQPMLYPLEQMQGKDSWEGLDGRWCRGNKVDGISPGDIDQSRSVLIGDLGPDRLIALDYRESCARPSVVALTANGLLSWRRVADDIETFMVLIGLNRSM